MFLPTHERTQQDLLADKELLEVQLDVFKKANGRLKRDLDQAQENFIESHRCRCMAENARDELVQKATELEKSITLMAKKHKQSEADLADLSDQLEEALCKLEALSDSQKKVQSMLDQVNARLASEIALNRENELARQAVERKVKMLNAKLDELEITYRVKRKHTENQYKVRLAQMEELINAAVKEKQDANRIIRKLTKQNKELDAHLNEEMQKCVEEKTKCEQMADKFKAIREERDQSEDQVSQEKALRRQVECDLEVSNERLEALQKMSSRAKQVIAE